MNTPQPEPPVAASEERIGDYRVHPVASLFPLLDGQEFDELVEDIEAIGQKVPIVVHNGVLLDGRNRLRACLKLGITPLIEQYRPKLNEEPGVWILSLNIKRRSLNAEERLAIWIQAEELMSQLARQAHERQQTGKSEDGTAGGRGHKKNLTQNPEQGLSDRNQRSTAGRIAAVVGVSRHKADQAVAVAKEAPELLDEVKRGKVKLKDAHAQVKAAKTAQPPAKKPGFWDVHTRLIHRIRHVMASYPQTQVSLRRNILRAIGVTAGADESLDAFRSRVFNELRAKRDHVEGNRDRNNWNTPAYRLDLVNILDWVELQLRGLPD